MKLDRKRAFSLAMVGAFLLLAGTSTATDIPLKNWAPVSKSAGRTSLADTGNPGLFVPITPCRQYDSRNTSALLQDTPLTVTLSDAPCGILSNTKAISVNITIFNISGATGNGVFWVGTVSPPTVAWINYPPTEAQRGNAGVVAVSSGALVVRVNQGAGSVDFVVDVNGYFIDSGVELNPGEYVGVLGTEDDGGLLYSRNYTTANFSTNSAVRGRISNTNPSQAIFGEQVAASGASYGVKGTSSSLTPGAAGVFGVDSSGPASGTDNEPSGVIGSSSANIGVEGISDNAGVRGEVYNGAGAFAALGILGFHSGANFYGVFTNGNMGGVGAKFFVEPHPTDASRVIRYIAMEGPESGTYFRGTARTVGRHAVIEVPESFRIVSDEEDLTIQLTPVGALATMAVMSQDLNRIVVNSSKDVVFHYLVQGVRRAFKGFDPIVEGGEFAPRGPKDVMTATLPDEVKRRLIANGTYSPDGTVNMATAERMGWAQKWRDNEAKATARQRAAENAAQGNRHGGQ